MSDYKLVPFEPTPEMVSAAEDAYMPFGDMDMAIRMALLAAPAVQGEPDVARHDAMRFALSEMVKWYENISLDTNPAFQYYNLAKKALLSAAPQSAEQQPDPFRGDNVALICSAQSLLSLDDKGAFGPNGIGGHARNIITAFIARISAEKQPAPDVAGLVEALEQIERWDGFPSTGKVWEDSGEPVSYGAAFGSNGERDFMREVARKALAAHRKQGGEP